MPSALFNAEAALVDPARQFMYTINPAWGENEWAVSGWSVTAGSDAALEHGASEALHAMGYRWWTPQKTTRPTSLPAGGVNLARQQFVMPYCSMFLNYGFGDSEKQTEFNRWRTLNNVADARRPAGHTWGSIVSWANAQNGYYTNNPWLLITAGATSFNLSDPVARAANLQKCCEYLRVYMNEFHRASFDPEDGDTQSSELVFSFANEVVAEMRATTHPDALLGLYAYAGHRAPVAFPCPYLYVQVALGFNNLGIGYQALVAQWGAVAAEVALRGYGDIAAWDGWFPMNSGITRRNFFIDEYPGYIASGASGINMETSAHWTKNIISHYHAIRFWKTGSGSHESVLSEAIPALYDNDPAVYDLFAYWGDPKNRPSAHTFTESCKIIDSMRPSAYKTDFMQYVTVAIRDFDLLKNQSRDGFYMTALERNLRWATYLGQSGAMHAYAYSRQVSNSNTTTNGRPDLNFANNPHWKRFPAPPSISDYEKARSDVSASVGRPSVMNDTDLVVVNVLPAGAAAVGQTGATDYTTIDIATFVFYGSGSVTITYKDAWRGVQTLSFEGELNEFTIYSSATTTWTGGILFMKNYPSNVLDPSSGGQRWAYMPKIVKGRLRLSSTGRLTLIDSVGRKDIKENFAPFSSGMANPQTVVPGVVRVDNINTRGTHQFGNLNPFISPSPTVQLMPRALAQRENLL